MSPEEFSRRLFALPAEKPDATDRAMLAEAEKEDDGTAVELETFMASLRSRDSIPAHNKPSIAY